MPASMLCAVAVLGASCTGDRAAAPGSAASPGAPTGLPRCEAFPGPVPEGFVEVRTREIRARDHVGLRRMFRDPDGRLLVYLLGVPGEVGEGSPTLDRVTLADGTPARLTGEGPNWAIAWTSRFPCRDMAIVGNGFTRGLFVALLAGAGILARD